MFPARQMMRPVARAALLRPLARSQHSSAVAPIALTQIETRWPKLPECEQGAIADHLAEKQKGDWNKMTLDEKRAAYWIAYGPYGARTPNDPAMKWKVLLWSGAFAGLAVAGWAYWTAAVIPELRTHAPEWKEEEERRAIENKQNPFTGVYSEVRKREDK